MPWNFTYWRNNICSSRQPRPTASRSAFDCTSCSTTKWCHYFMAHGEDCRNVKTRNCISSLKNIHTAETDQCWRHIHTTAETSHSLEGRCLRRQKRRSVQASWGMTNWAAQSSRSSHTEAHICHGQSDHMLPRYQYQLCNVTHHTLLLLLLLLSQWACQAVPIWESR